MIASKKICGHDVPFQRKLIKCFNIIPPAFVKYDRRKMSYISLTFSSEGGFPSLIKFSLVLI